jgi:hypothetical protein
MSEKRQAFWVASNMTFAEVLDEAKRDPPQAAKNLFDLRHELVNTQNALQHLTGCLLRAVAERDDFEERLRVVGNDYELRGDEIDRLRKQVVQQGKKRPAPGGGVR